MNWMLRDPRFDADFADRAELYLVMPTGEGKPSDIEVGPKRGFNVYVQGVDEPETLEYWKKLLQCGPEEPPLVRQHRPNILLIFFANGSRIGMATIDWGSASIGMDDCVESFGRYEFNALSPVAIEVRRFFESALRRGKRVSGFTQGSD